MGPFGLSGGRIPEGGGGGGRPPVNPPLYLSFRIKILIRWLTKNGKWISWNDTKRDHLSDDRSNFSEEVEVPP